MKTAKAKGRLRGKQPKLNPRQEAHLVALHQAGELSTAELADLFGVGRSTVYRALERSSGAVSAGRDEAPKPRTTTPCEVVSSSATLPSRRTHLRDGGAA
jgi:hypothetical protein